MCVCVCGGREGRREGGREGQSGGRGGKEAWMEGIIINTKQITTQHTKSQQITTHHT